MNKTDVILLALAIGLIILVPGSFIHSALTWRRTVIYEGTLKYATTSTLEFEDGEIFTHNIRPLFIENETKSLKTHYNFDWYAKNLTLYKGHKYQIVKLENSVFFFSWASPALGLGKAYHIIEID